MASLEELDAIEQIKKLKARYFRYLDTKDWDSFQEVFAPDATLDTTTDRPDVPVVQGNDKIREYVERDAGPISTVHQGHTPEIEITSPTTATGIWAMQDVLKMPKDSPLGIKGLVAWGHYIDTYEQIDGAWKIKSSRLTRIRRQVEL